MYEFASRVVVAWVFGSSAFSAGCGVYCLL